LLLMFVYCK